MNGGYGKPPKNGQFKKGQSGNPKGRPKRPSQPVSTAYLFRKIANETVVVETGSGNSCTLRATISKTCRSAFSTGVAGSPLNG